MRVPPKENSALAHHDRSDGRSQGGLKDAVHQRDEWLVAHRYLSLGSLALLEEPESGPEGPAGASQPALDEGALAGAGKPTT